MRQYEHTELNENGKAYVERVPYAGRDILLRHFYGDKKIGPFVSVKGFISGEYMRRREGTLVPVTDVEPIVDITQRTELTDLLKQKGENKLINF
jgi:hypothetical protein